ncbi:uncharacterized protein LOC123007127 [Tribolium madens]|uniref:uncharacterized protein LOC123007127 n=1 Tax=Tribolium madens TaxID=41895 RepID=UPI001CF72BAD|nr:uncharacterized protein LOC123007127 [Tribolium madens]
MLINIYLTSFFSFIYFFRTILSHDENCASFQQCIFVAMGDEFYGLFIENVDSKDFTLRRFVGVCDLDTLKKWNPCPFGINKTCSPGSNQTYYNFCNINSTALQPRCNCKCTLKSHELEPIPNFPTCLLGDRYGRSKRSLVFRRIARRTAPVINNCIQCMTKHPDVRMVRVGPLLWRRVKRGEITPSSILDHFRTIKYKKLFDCHHSILGPCAFNRKYRSPVPVSAKNRQFYRHKLPNSELALEESSNNALFRIFRQISKNKLVRKRKSASQGHDDEEIEDDDDENDDDNIGEDIAIEEDNDEENIVSTTEIPEKDEIKQQLHENKNYNFTNSEEDIKISKNTSDSSGTTIKSTQIVLVFTCGVNIVNLF